MKNDENVYENKCTKCDTWSVENSKGDWRVGGYEMCMDGKERWFTNYRCVNCESEISISEEMEEDGDGIDEGDVVCFE